MRFVSCHDARRGSAARSADDCGLRGGRRRAVHGRSARFQQTGSNRRKLSSPVAMREDAAPADRRATRTASSVSRTQVLLSGKDRAAQRSGLGLREREEGEHIGRIGILPSTVRSAVLEGRVQVIDEIVPVLEGRSFGDVEMGGDIGGRGVAIIADLGVDPVDAFGLRHGPAPKQGKEGASVRTGDGDRRTGPGSGGHDRYFWLLLTISCTVLRIGRVIQFSFDATFLVGAGRGLRPTGVCRAGAPSPADGACRYNVGKLNDLAWVERSL